MNNETILFQVYCGPVPQIDNGFAVTSTNVSLNGQASYTCYAGFGFSSGQPVETIQCTIDGTWSYTPTCQASQCPPLPEVMLLFKSRLFQRTVGSSQ